MDSSTLKHALILSVSLGLIMVSAIYAVIGINVHAHGHVPSSGRNEVVKSTSRREWVQIDEQTKNELVEISRCVVDAYTNFQGNVMLQRFDELLKRSCDVTPDRYSDLMQPIFRSLYDNFFKENIKWTCLDVEQFKSYVEISRKIVESLWEGEVERHSHDIGTMVLEWDYLKKLYEFQSYFKEHNAPDLLNVTDLLICEWISRIDSCEGMTRTYALWQFDLNMGLVNRKKSTRSEVVMSVQSMVRPLAELLGRPPKWIDEIK